MKSTIYLSSILLILASCGSDDDEAITAEVSFSTISDSGSEDAGTISVPLLLNAALDTDIQINYGLSGDAALNGDFRLLSPNPINIPAGSTNANIELEIIDDELIEIGELSGSDLIETDGKQIIMEITSASGNTIISETQHTYTYDLADDDIVSEEGMQVDLSWTVQNSTDIDEVDLNLRVLYDVVIENNSITEAEIYEEAGENQAGYETLTVMEDAPDSEYYVVVEYADGTATADFLVLVFLSESITFGFESFNMPTDENNWLIYGPIAEKAGSNFSRQLYTSYNTLPKSTLKIDKSLFK